ncbi:MAG TPA: glycosyltransferase family 9 protein, partial [Magnetospirillum sp.]|nr:glycosyltransferase family 9 protein [Magnetospirillum sp.]
LTTKPYAALAAASAWFDHVWVDEKPKMWQVPKVLKLKRKLASGRFDRVYDLQTSDRSGWYFRLMGGEVDWSGIASGCSLPHANPGRDDMHTFERQAEQLAMAGIEVVPPPDLSWADGDVGRFGLPKPFALICPGGAPHRPAKRWAAENFGEIAAWLAARGITPVLLGTEAERPEIETVRTICGASVSLLGKTQFIDVLGLGRQALAAIGNDTGPMHLIATAGCPSVVLFSHESDPNLCAPRGRVTILRRPSLADLPADEVEQALARLLG